MRSTLVVVLALLVLAVAVLAVALQGGDTGSVEPGEILLVRDVEPTGYRSAVDPSPDPAPAAGRVRAAAADVVVSLRLRCVDRQGSPVAGCRVGVAPRTARAASLPEARWHGVTAADGTCSIALDDHQDACVVWIRGEGIATALGSLPADRALLRDLGDVVVHPGRRVRLRFVDGEARAVRDVRCELAYGPRSAEKVQPVRSFTATSDESGAFDLDEPLATGPWGIQVSSAQLVSERVFAIDAGPGPQQLEFVVVPPEAVILGVVVDDQGAPLSRANVWATIDDRHVSMPCQTGADGSFVLARAAQLTGLFRGPVVRLAAGRSGMDPGAPVDAMWGERAARLVVRSGVGFTVLLRDEDGTPVEAAQVQLHGKILASGPKPWAARSGHFPNGRVMFDSLSRGEAYLRVTPDDPRLVQPEEPLLVIGDAGSFEHTVALVRAHSRLLRVVGPDGAPVAGSTFELVRLPPGAELYPPEGGFHEQHYRTIVARDGSFALSGLPGDWTLHPTRRDAVHGVIQAQGPDKLALASGAQRRVDLALRMGRATLVLRDAAGQSIAGARPVLRYLDGRFCADLPPTDAGGRTQSGLLDCTAFEVLVPPRRLLTSEARLEFARTAGPMWRLLLGKHMVRLGVVTPQPHGVVVELVAPPPFEQ